MTEDLLNQLCEALDMSPEQVMEQGVGFAYANAKMSNPDITVEMVRASFVRQS